jgi:D-arabinose 1-dehydrogenase-like Zn-dependent alcohol dehydrogenase
MADMVKTAMGWNFATSALGAKIMGEIIDLVLAGAVKPIVGRTITFDEIPTAIEAMEHRETTGRVVALLDS